MSETPVAGTFRLDGMLQGPVPDAATAGDMESWAASAKKSGLVFHLSVDGPNFSIVPDPSAQKSSSLAQPDLEQLLTDALDALLTLLPVEKRTAVFSTVRSEEFRPGRAVQTLYAVGADGKINSEQRTIDVETEDPPSEITAASVKRAIIPALFFLILALFISSFFIDYRKLWSEAKDSFVPLKKEELAVDHAAVSDYVTVEMIEVEKNGRWLKFKLSRGPKWDAAINSKPADSESWADFVTRLAIHERRLRVEFRNKENKIIREAELPIAPLHKAKTYELELVGRFRDRPAKIIVRP